MTPPLSDHACDTSNAGVEHASRRCRSDAGIKRDQFEIDSGNSALSVLIQQKSYYTSAIHPHCRPTQDKLRHGIFC